MVGHSIENFILFPSPFQNFYISSTVMTMVLSILIYKNNKVQIYFCTTKGINS